MLKKKDSQTGCISETGLISDPPAALNAVFELSLDGSHDSAFCRSALISTYKSQQLQSTSEQVHATEEN